MSSLHILPELENDALFLPASLRSNKPSLHGDNDELYIVYYNNDANDASGCFEIQILDRHTVLRLYNHVGRNCLAFFDYLPLYFENRWQYADRNTPSFDYIYSIYNSADFIVSRDGNLNDEFNYIIQWASNSNV